MSLTKRYRSLKNPIALSGRTNVNRYVKTSAKKIEHDLSKIYSYLVHREIKRPRNFNPIYVYDRREIIQGDLCDLQNINTFNDGVKYLLVLIDSFSRKAWVKPLKSKKASEVLQAFRQLHKQIGNFKVLYFDRGTEITNKEMRRELKNKNIELRFPTNKVGTVERFLRTLQSLIYKYMTEYATDRYIDRLQDIVDLYNSRYHRTIKTNPNFADKAENRNFVLNALGEKYDKAERKRKKPKYKVGQSVLISKNKGAFAKSYKMSMIRQRYIIHEVHDKLPQPMYTLKDELDEIIEGRFYEAELQAVNSDEYRIYDIIGTKKINGVEHKLVVWEGYENKPQFNTWVPTTQLSNDF